jgi:hypothetical protein
VLRFTVVSPYPLHPIKKLHSKINNMRFDRSFTEYSFNDTHFALQCRQKLKQNNTLYYKYPQNLPVFADFYTIQHGTLKFCCASKNRAPPRPRIGRHNISNYPPRPLICHNFSTQSSRLGPLWPLPADMTTSLGRCCTAKWGRLKEYYRNDYWNRDEGDYSLFMEDRTTCGGCIRSC